MDDIFKDMKIIGRPADFKPTVTFGDHTYTAEEFKELSDKMTFEDKLSEDQLDVLFGLKKVYKEEGLKCLRVIHHLLDEDEDYYDDLFIESYYKLNEPEETEIIIAFCTWVLKEGFENV